MAMAILRPAAATAYRRLSIRLLNSSAAASPTLLGYFHQPRPLREEPVLEKLPAGLGCRWKFPEIHSTIRFVPAAPSSQLLGLDFLPDPVWRYDISDSHLGLLLRRRGSRDPDLLIACDPVRRLYAVLPPVPPEATKGSNVLVGTALLSRGKEHPLEFDAVCLTIVATGWPRAWIASFSDSSVSCWRPLPPSEAIRFEKRDTYSIDPWCVHAGGGLFWHLSFTTRKSVLALDPTTMEFARLRMPEWKYRVGEMRDDGRLRSATLRADYKLRVFVLPDSWWVPKRQVYKTCSSLSPLIASANFVWASFSNDDDKKSDHGWLLERETCLRKVLESMPPWCDSDVSYLRGTWLSAIDTGRTGKVFIRTINHGQFSYDMESGELKQLITNNRHEQYGDPMFAYFNTAD